MKDIDRQAVAEVIEILNHSESEITNKIPEKFMQFLAGVVGLEPTHVGIRIRCLTNLAIPQYICKS